MIKKRIARLRALMSAHGLDAALITNPPSRRYLSGYSPDDGQWGESSGALYISQTRAYILTDFRYELTAREECRYLDVRIYKKGLAEEIATIAEEDRISKLGFEPEGMLYAWYESLADALGEVELISAKRLVSGFRMFKDASEVKVITASIRLMEGVLDQVLSSDLVGLSEREVALRITRDVEDAGAEGVGFDPIVACGPNGAEPHAEPGGKVIQMGDIVLFDVGAKLNGYISDMSRTVIAGGVEHADEKFRDVYSTVRKAQIKAIHEIMPGMSGAEADSIARQVIEDAGYGDKFGHSLGHGVGLITHEAPGVGPRSEDELLPGMIFTIEPGIYLPGWGGIRLEDMVEMTEHGCRLLNKLDHYYDFST
jgi:Xaa-Pro aminopeptidase